MESLHKIVGARMYLVVVSAADKALQAIWLQSRWRMRISDIDVVHPADAPSSHRKLLCTLWCLLVSQTSLCSLLCRLSSLSVWLLIIQRQTDLRSSAAAAKEKQERWRSSIRPTGRTHEIRGQLLGGSLEEKIVPVSFFLLHYISSFAKISAGLSRSARTSVW